MLIKKIVFWIIISLFSIFSGLVIHNNFGDDNVTKEEIQASFNQAVAWIKINREQIQSSHNPIIWWMVGEAAKTSKNPELNDIFSEYKKNNTDKYRSSVWAYFFFKSPSPLIINDSTLFTLPDYNLYFIYGFSCNSDLAKLEVIKEQNEISFCWKNYPLSQACFTHQQMGFRFLERISCHKVEQLSEKIESLSENIKFQSIFDFRLVDVYIQRVLVQVESGKQHKVNMRWVKRIIANQGDDGGWGDFQTLFKIQGNKYISFSSKGFSVGTPRSNFHATTQGLWLMALLLNQDNEGMQRF